MSTTYRWRDMDVVELSVSFASGQQGAYQVPFPYKAQIVKIVGTVTSAVAGTDSGTITGANSVGNSSGGVLTFAASAPFGNQQTATPTTNNVVAAGGSYTLTTAKTTAGGVVSVILHVLKGV